MAIALCGFSRARTRHFFCFQCWTCSVRARSKIQPAAGYLFDKAGNTISSVTSFGGSVTTDPGGEAFRLALGGFFPLLANGTSPPDIYGAHLDITLPNSSTFDVIGGELGLFPNALQDWHNHFQIGDVPDSLGSLIQCRSRSRSQSNW